MMTQREGIPWAPTLPPSWSHAHLRWLADIYAGGTPDRENPDYWRDGTVPWLNSGAVNDWAILEPSELITDAGLARSSARWVPAKSVVIGLAGQGRTKGTSARLEIPSTTNQSMAAIVPGPALNYRFLHYWLVSNYQSIRNLAGGDKRDGLNLQHIAGIECPLPPTAEQQEIADYLDRETAQIDTLIAKQEQLIATLRERRQSVIDGTFLPSKDNVPVRLRNILVAKPTYGVLVPIYIETDDSVPFIRVGDLGSINAVSPLAQISAAQSAEYSRTQLLGGEVLLGVVGRMGQVAIAPERLAGANVARAVAVLRCTDPASSALAAIWLTSTLFLDQAGLATSGDSVQPTLGMGDLASFDLQWPKDSEVCARVLSDLQDQIAAIDALKAKAERFIEISKERRAALITAAVTGQIDATGRATSWESSTNRRSRTRSLQPSK